MQLSGVRLSVPSVRCTLLRRVCCCEHIGQEISIMQQLMHGRQSAPAMLRLLAPQQWCANADSATLSADV